MSSTKGGSGRYASKLTFEERCGFYYAFLLGISKSAIEIASGLNRGTVTRLCDRKYKAYGEVHLKFDELGLKKFRDRYWTIEMMDRVAAALAGVAGPGTGPGVCAPRGGCTDGGAAPIQRPDDTQQPPAPIHLRGEDD